MESVLRALQPKLAERCRAEPANAVAVTGAVCDSPDARNPLEWRVVVTSHPDVNLMIEPPANLGGSGVAPCPGDLLAMALAACMDGAIRICADISGVELDRIRVEVVNRGDVRGLLGVDDLPPPPDTGIFMQVEVVPAPGADPEKVARVLAYAEQGSAILNVIRSGAPVTVMSTSVEKLGSSTAG